MIDANVYLGQWPYRRLPLDEPGKLVARLRENRFTEAWASSFEGLFHRDLAGVNRRMAEQCQATNGFLKPVGVVDPTAHGWEEDLDRCAEEWRMRAIRLLPAYHGYNLGDPPFEALLRRATAKELVVQLPLVMEDDRTRHPRFSPSAVDATGLASLIGKVDGLRLIILNTGKALTMEQAADVIRAGRVVVDIAMIESLEGVARWVEAIGPEHLCVGTYAPFFYPEAAVLKLAESGLPESVLAKIRSTNVEQLLK